MSILWGAFPVNVSFRRLVSASVALLIILLVMLCMVGFARHLSARRGARPQQGLRAAPTGTAWPTEGWGDRFGDGMPDFLRLTDPADQAAFRRWFTLIAEYQAIRPRAELPEEITDCASLLRFSYREALKRHNDSWFLDTGIDV